MVESVDPSSAGAGPSDAVWLARFHEGDRGVMAECYRQHFATVERAVGRVLPGADQETVIHEVFYQLLASAEVRRGFTGGSLAAWLATMARHRAIDAVRRTRREQPLEDGMEPPADDYEPEALAAERRAAAQALVARFRRERLPQKWARVFEARFLEQRSQRDAAARLGISRTTLAYQELRIRALLRRFLLREEAP